VTKSDQVFCDGVSMIAATGGVVRLDFVTLSATERDANGNPKAEFSHRMIMPIEGFVPFVGKLQETVQALMRRGVVRQQPAASPPPDVANDERGAMPPPNPNSDETSHARAAPAGGSEPPARPFP
jgi:hypothetical protein